jgi:hypothetical protein
MADKKATVNFTHQGVWYGPDYGDGTVPAEVAKQVGPHVFGEYPEQVDVAEAPVEDVKNAPASEGRDERLGQEAQSGGAPDDVVGSAPPKAGPGSGVDAWRTYAEANGVEVDEDASRTEVIDAVEKAGLPV